MQVVLSCNTKTICNIMQDVTQNVSVDGLPSVWPRNTNTASLPCGHAFHPSALALHFCSRNMRCPVCRAGSDSTLDVDSLPLSVRAPMRERVASIPRDDDDDLGISDIDSSDILAPLELMCRMRGATHIVARSPVLVPADDLQLALAQSTQNGESAPDATRILCGVQRSFRRRLNAVLSANSFTAIDLCITHPLFPYALRAQRPSLNGRDLVFPMSCPGLFGNAMIAEVMFVHEGDTFDVRLRADVAKLRDTCTQLLLSVINDHLTEHLAQLSPTSTPSVSSARDVQTQ